ncbi:MAG TPA: hypothetical protein VHL53_07165 [Acidimicrobiia bacterium]|nr:hypothetical protein [Acidimicrobiia bacterium]
MIDPQWGEETQPDGGRLQVLESCSSTWVFDTGARQFRRLPRNTSVTLEVPGDWTPYVSLHLDEVGSWFVVQLDATGTRLLRAWLHGDPCPRCRSQGVSLPRRLGALQRWKQRLHLLPDGAA